MKQRLGEVGIGPRLAAAFIAVAFLTLASGAIGLIGFWQASTAAQILVENTEMIRTVQEIRATVGPLLGPPGDFILARDPSAAGRYAESIEQVGTSIDTYEQAHQAHSHSTKHSLSAAALISSTRADIVQLTLLGDALFATGDNNQALNLLDEMEALLLEANERLTALLVNAEEDILSARNAHAIAQRNANIGLTVSALCAFSLAVGLAFFFTRSISKPLTELADATDRIIEGDLSTPIIVEASGEIDRLAKSFERMRLTLVRERGQVRLLAVLEERDRIGREMHDGLAQVLGYVNTKAQAVQEFLRAGQTDQATQQLQELIAAAQEAYTDAREIIVGLRLNDVHERQLTGLAEEYVGRFQRRSGVTTDLMIAPSWDDTAVPATVKAQSLRIIQEALTNARKHAGAGHVGVTLDRRNNSAVIMVKDDGCGFMLSRLLRPDFSRYGLRTMRERAQAVGGTLRIESAPGKGTCIEATMPLVEEESATI